MLGSNVGRAIQVLAQGGAAVSHTGNTNETVLATITVPANAMGSNGQVVIDALFSHTNSANSKTLKIKFGGAIYFNNAPTTTASIRTQLRIANRGAANSQVGHPSGLNNPFNATSGAPTTSAVDTSANVTIEITGQLALGTETITLESYQVLLYPRN